MKHNAPFSIVPVLDDHKRRILERVVMRFTQLGWSGWPDLAEALGEEPQVTNNWPKRGIPAHRHPEVAAALGWSIAQLLGDEPRAEPRGWPFQTIPMQRFDTLSKSDQLHVEAAMLEEIERLDALRTKRRKHPQKPHPGPKRGRAAS